MICARFDFISKLFNTTITIRNERKKINKNHTRGEWENEDVYDCLHIKFNAFRLWLTRSFLLFLSTSFYKKISYAIKRIRFLCLCVFVYILIWMDESQNIIGLFCVSLFIRLKFKSNQRTFSLSLLIIYDKIFINYKCDKNVNIKRKMRGEKKHRIKHYNFCFFFWIMEKLIRTFYLPKNCVSQIYLFFVCVWFFVCSSNCRWLIRFDWIIFG